MTRYLRHELLTGGGGLLMAGLLGTGVDGR